VFPGAAFYKCKREQNFREYILSKTNIYTSLATAFMNACSKSHMIVEGCKTKPNFDPFLFKDLRIASYVSYFLFDVRIKHTGTTGNIRK